MLMESKSSSFSSADSKGANDIDTPQMSHRLTKVKGGGIMIESTPKIKRRRSKVTKHASGYVKVKRDA